MSIAISRNIFEMSDIYKGTTIILLGDCPNTHLSYVLKQRESGNEVVFWLKIKLETLASWRRDMLSSLKAGVYYIDLVNLSIPGDAFRLNRESVRLETQLSKICINAENNRKIANRKGSLKQRQLFLEKWTKIAVWRNDIITVEEWKSEVGSLAQKLEAAEAHIEEWKQKYADIEKAKEALFKEMLEEKELNSACQQECANMKKYIRQLEKDQFCQVKGTAIPKLKSTQAQNKKLKELKSRAQKALHFSRLFGLEVDCLKFKDQDSSKTYTVEFNNASVRSEVSDTSDSILPSSPNTSHCSTVPDTPPCTPDNTSSSTSSNDISPPSPQTQYSKLSEDDKAKVESILYLIDKFGVGDEFVHELSMTIDGFPKSYLFKQSRTELNKSCIINSTPGKAPGAQHSFRQLLTDQVQQMVCTNLACSFFFFFFDCMYVCQKVF